MSNQTWTPAPRRGAIPLHPMTFGMLLGKSFAALRHNPKVLIGFAVTIQLGVAIVLGSVMGLMLWLSAVRMESVPPGSPDFDTIAIGTAAVNIVVGILVALVAIGFVALVQGVVAADVAYAAVNRKASLRLLWQRVKPAVWRLIGWVLLQSLALLLIVGVAAGMIVGAIFGASVAGGDGYAAVGLTFLLILLIAPAFIVLIVWLSTKLLLVPSVLVLEHQTVRIAMVRSWRLTRGRFWPAFGVIFLISMIMGIAAQVVSVPGTIISTLLAGTFAPTGETETSTMIATFALFIVPQILIFAVQAIALVVEATAGTLVYLDSRMRYEGLDQALIAYIERSADGVSDDALGDPYRVDPYRAVTSAPPSRSAPVITTPPVVSEQMPRGFNAPPMAAPPGPPPAHAAPSTTQAAPPAPQPVAPPAPSPDVWAPPGHNT